MTNERSYCLFDIRKNVFFFKKKQRIISNSKKMNLANIGNIF